MSEKLWVKNKGLVLGRFNVPALQRLAADHWLHPLYLVSEDEKGTAPAKKPTSILTNSVEVYRCMGRKCRGGHRHAPLMEGRARQAAREMTIFPLICFTN